MQKFIVNNNGYIKRVVFDENIICEENEKIAPLCFENYIKPRWNGSVWVEGATEEEIKTWQEENITTEKEATTEDYLMDLDYRISKIELGLEEK